VRALHTPAAVLPDLFAILKCTEKLERAYVRDGVTAKDYEAQCEKLIAQFRMLWGSMKETVRGITAAAAAALVATAALRSSYVWCYAVGLHERDGEGWNWVV
jgi:hypothetical protein